MDKIEYSQKKKKDKEFEDLQEQLYEYARSHYVVHFKWVNCMYVNYISVKLLKIREV